MNNPTTQPDSGPAADTVGEPGRMLDAFAELQNLLLAGDELADFLRQVALLAARVVPGGSCGITLRRDGEVATVASSDAFALQVDEIQYGTGQGPCLQSMADNTEISVSDLTEDTRWGDYRVHAVTHGVRSSLSLPLAVRGTAVGALNLYARVPHAFVGSAVSRGREFARHAAGTLTAVLERADQTVLEDQMRDALATRAVIDQAIGILMGQRRITAPAAFAVLREASQNQNRKLADIAAALIQTFTGQPPAPPRPFTPPR